jgi:hypothetical protein
MASDQDTSGTEQERRVAKRLPVLFLECRTIGHAWTLGYIGPVAGADPELATRARRHPWHPDAARILVCLRCQTERVDLCVYGYGRGSYAYRVVSRSYRYPDAYALEGVHGSRDFLHEELFRRARKGTVPE